MMQDCWQDIPNDRPSFERLAKQLGDLLQDAAKKTRVSSTEYGVFDQSQEFGSCQALCAFNFAQAKYHDKFTLRGDILEVMTV